MTSRERILTAIRCEKPDRVPVSPFGLGKLDPNGSDAAELIAKTDPFITAGIGGNSFMGERFQTESRQEGNDTVTTIITPKGNLTQRYRRTDITGCTVEFPCKNADDVEKYSKHYILTEKGRAKVVMVSADEYEAWQETFQVAQEIPDLKKDIEAFKKDLKSGAYKKYKTIEEIIGVDYEPKRKRKKV